MSTSYVRTNDHEELRLAVDNHVYIFAMGGVIMFRL